MATKNLKIYLTERKTGDIFITVSDRYITCFLRIETKKSIYGGKSMIKKHLIVASMVIVSICSCLVVGKSVKNAFAKDRESVSTKPIVYSYEDKDYMEAIKDFVYDEESAKDPKHNLMVDYVDNFKYSQSSPIEYSLGDSEYEFMVDSEKIETHYLQDTKGNNIPTSFWNLTNNPYQYAIVNMYSSCYTDFYFNTNSNGYISMSMGTLNSGGNNITIECYELGGSSNPVMSWTGNPQSIQGLGWGPLNQYKLYYFKFIIGSGSLSGSGYIHH